MTIYGVQSITYNPPTATGAPSATDADPAAQEMDFLKLLVAQITNQTPDSPMDPTAMITQYSQMQAAVGLVKLNNASRAYQNSSLAAGLMNQNVRIHNQAMGDEGSQIVEGTVTAVDFSTDIPRVQVNGQYYSLTDVIHVGA
ncbi:MAG TPA: flagellar hook capping FlgD N-terminal domain-containing protein [Stenomitos sp.]